MQYAMQNYYQTLHYIEHCNLFISCYSKSTQRFDSFVRALNMPYYTGRSALIPSSSSSSSSFIYALTDICLRNTQVIGTYTYVHIYSHTFKYSYIHTYICIGRTVTHNCIHTFIHTIHAVHSYPTLIEPVP